jgi:hypothetical protein
VDAKALITVRRNRYSVPVALAGLKVSVAIGATEIRVCHRDPEVARHERPHGEYATRVTFDHYLELLGPQARRARPLAAAGPGTQPRQLAADLRRAVVSSARTVESEGDKQMIDVPMLCREHSLARVELAGPGVLAAGATDGRYPRCRQKREQELSRFDHANRLTEHPK